MGTRAQAFLGRLTGRCAVEGYVTGNYGADRAAELASVVEDLLKARGLMRRYSGNLRAAQPCNPCIICANLGASHPRELRSRS